MGYIEFANYIKKVMLRNIHSEQTSEYKREKKIKNVKKEFSNRLLIIDEIQNIRSIESDPKLKKTSQFFYQIVKYTDSLKLLLLSATPMFNSHKEIIWILNLMNLNDNRSAINESDIFDIHNNLIVSENGEEIGKNILIQKSTGYISFLPGWFG